ncbi:DHA2 family efflux MFS transporter permease subunit [Lapidilactobacillus wuchangensis]|uniref:DHA2 family efflux MFS transporter permease subunit n=1 Tax=Lapidilactobacillus wuchangensis TaxID=2486001 RepID=UPI000F76CFF1|nr:DHA2 family efflux MFS transporter permease subunit [Lapidilactobacillus wuchangensis]
MTNQKIPGKVFGAIIATGLMSFCGVIVETAMNITFPTLMTEFKVTTSTVQWMTTIYLLIVAIIVPLSANLKRSFATRKLFLTANLLFMTGVILDLVAPNFVLLLIGRVVQGLGTGIALPLMFNIILEQVPREKIGLMMGMGTLITAIAPAIGPTFGGLVVTSLNWRYIFAFLLPILICSLVLGLLTIEQKTPTHFVRLDLLSVLAISLTFVGLILGLNQIGSHAFWSWPVAGALVAGILGAVLLVFRSRQLASPIINFQVFHYLRFSGHVTAFFIMQLIALGLSFILPNYIQLVNGQTAIAAGLTVLPGAVLGAIFAPVSGKILDELGPQKPILIGASLSILAVILFSLTALQLNSVMISGFYLVFMAGIGLAFGNIMTNGLKNLPAALQSDGNAVLTTVQQFAGAVGTSLVAMIISQSQTKLGKTTTSLATAVGSQHAFQMLVLLGILELVLLILVVRPQAAANTTN